jgi:transcriptional regulator with XRE-family HTH domain
MSQGKKSPENRALRVVLEQHDMTQQDLASRAGLSAVTVSRVFNSHQTLSVATAERVASILGTTAEALGLVEAEARCE